ncbi:uncharacterized protein ARMOST_21799 [Armillaria ostoyae]|uniref:Uncharacterized protein n=1 Tax=Armillaria ostoyae TaxID=47428 RepID=A0A284SB34_ARMOS|nr:uncharacterized protein ARMOST_21799 [Armillaria ostoyae]
MPALTASPKLRILVAASGIPYFEKRAKIIIAVVEPFEKKGMHKADLKELCKGIYRMAFIIRSLKRFGTIFGMHGSEEQGISRCFAWTWRDMDR